jgi:hypothetical protein
MCILKNKIYFCFFFFEVSYFKISTKCIFVTFIIIGRFAILIKANTDLFWLGIFNTRNTKFQLNLWSSAGAGVEESRTRHKIDFFRPPGNDIHPLGKKTRIKHYFRHLYSSRLLEVRQACPWTTSACVFFYIRKCE